MKKRTILQKTVTGMVLLALLLIIGTCAAAGYQFRKRNFEIYHDYAYTYTHLAADIIDGDAIGRYVETEQTDPYYEDISLIQVARICRMRL